MISMSKVFRVCVRVRIRARLKFRVNIIRVSITS
jgi:hypothetical protein